MHPEGRAERQEQVAVPTGVGSKNGEAISIVACKRKV